MKAIQFNGTVPRYVLGKGLGKLYPAVLWKGLSCTYPVEIAAPRLPGDEWVRIRTRYGGICGSDLSAIYLTMSPYYSPFTSFPYTFGHESVGTVSEVTSSARDLQPGERVVVEPLLWCKPRGFEDLCRYCARGEINLCERTTRGVVSEGISIGFCRDTGGSWSESFVAHESQIFRLPESVSDESGLLVEPFAVALHGVLGDPPRDGERVLVQGAGTIGLLVVAAIKALELPGEVYVSARYPFQQEAAMKLGADHVITAGQGTGLIDLVAEHTGGEVLTPLIGKRVLNGGFDHTFECVGSESALDDALRFTRAGGRVLLFGQQGMTRKVDWTPVFHNELRIRGSSYYNHAEQYHGKVQSTYELALDLLESRKVSLDWMVTHRFSLDEYDRALEMSSNRGKFEMIKGVFDFGRG